MKATLPLYVLLGLPATVYAASYIYLAFYHGQAVIINTVVHEGGLYTFLQTILYASHFLGHIPVHTVLALYFVGVYMCLTPHFYESRLHLSRWPFVFLLVNFLLASVAISLIGFGLEDTMAFILQQKQNVRHYTAGGSWNLHLPSTLLQLALIPVFIFAVRLFFARPLHASRRGSFYIGVGLFLIVAFTGLVNEDPAFALGHVLSDPRHLAHSVREIATFPLIYYPLPLYLFLTWEGRLEGARGNAGKALKIFMGLLTIVFVSAFLYQMLVPLAQGVGALAQKPAFMKGESLPIAHLLASHYFEHFLDTIYFLLVCMILFAFAAPVAGNPKRGKI